MVLLFYTNSCVRMSPEEYKTKRMATLQVHSDPDYLSTRTRRVESGHDSGEVGASGRGSRGAVAIGDERCGCASLAPRSRVRRRPSKS